MDDDELNGLEELVASAQKRRQSNLKRFTAFLFVTTVFLEMATAYARYVAGRRRNAYGGLDRRAPRAIDRSFSPCLATWNRAGSGQGRWFWLTPFPMGPMADQNASYSQTRCLSAGLTQGRRVAA